MRWSQAFIPTLRDDPSDADAVSHRLLVRAGFIRQLMAGSYSILPAAFRVRAKIDRIIREEIDAIGGQQFLLGALHPADVWRRSGRWDVMGDEMFRIVDRKGADVALGMTHEEIFATVASELTSYKQLPQLWYQIQTKFRDEPRPKSGLLRVREFTMKDSYSLDIDQDGLDKQFDAHYGAYERIFSRLGLDAIAVDASSGAMGGSGSVEFMVRSDAGEDLVAYCQACGYAANVERAVSVVPAIDDEGGPDALEMFDTPGVRTIQALETFPGGATADRQVKTLVYVADDTLVLALLRGDHALQEQKLADALGVGEVRPAEADEIRGLLGADAGSLGAVDVLDVTVIADDALRGRTSMTTGANINDKHYRGVDVDRDIAVTRWESLREVVAGERCASCDSGTLEVFKTIECGHIFKLGTKYAEALGATVLDENGKSRPIVMGSYGIGLERNLAAVVEVHHDEKGIVWPVSVAPWHVVVTVVRAKDEASQEVASSIADGLEGRGWDVMIDDRNERPGVKFADAELVGFPYRITVGPRGLETGTVEVVDRRSGTQSDVALDAVVDHVHGLLSG
ncbi:MAG: proline--tRNA ligase [Actinobacteria bacterium]|nr:proline--tRNA ligase [Actinomycetota bacterium]